MCSSDLIPLDINGVTYDASGKITGDFINSKKLNEIMNKMKRSYDDLNTDISNGTIIPEDKFDQVKNEITDSITKLNEQKTKLAEIIIKLEEKEVEFNKLFGDNVNISKATDLKFKKIRLLGFPRLPVHIFL